MQLKFSEENPILKMSIQELQSLLEGQTITRKSLFGDQSVTLDVIPHGQTTTQTTLSMTNSNTDTVFQVDVCQNHLEQLMAMGKDKNGLSVAGLQMQVDIKSDTR